MAYSDFKNLEEIKEKLGVKIVDRNDLFSTVSERQPTDLLTQILSYNIRLALAIHTEKARSELIVMPILVEMLKVVETRVSLFSGVKFAVDEQQGLCGICDFIISQSDEQTVVSAPVIAMVEAKDDNIKEGLPQCAAEMVAAKIFNERKGNKIPIIYGVVTTGEIWKFLKLENQKLFIDGINYYIKEINKIFGILVHIVTS